MSKRHHPNLRRAGGNWNGKSEYNEHHGKRYDSGNHWAVCQRCGFDVRESNMVLQWDGLKVCKGCKDPRQPQDFVRGRADKMAPVGNANSASPYDRTELPGSTASPGGSFGDYLGDEVIGDPSGGPGIAPDEIPNLELWWDLSERDGNFVFSDASRTTAISNNDPVEGVTDRSGNGFHAVTHTTPANNSWEEATRNGHGTASNTSRTVASPIINMSVWSTPLEQPYTLIGVGAMHDSTGDVNRERWFSSKQGVTHTFFTRFIGTGQVMEVYKQSGAPVDITETPALAVGTWWMIMVEVNGASSRIWLNNQEITLGDAIEPTGTIEGWSFLGDSTVGAPGGMVFDTPQGETCVFSTAILSDSDRTGLWEYMQDKWDLTEILP